MEYFMSPSRKKARFPWLFSCPTFFAFFTSSVMVFNILTIHKNRSNFMNTHDTVKSSLHEVLTYLEGNVKILKWVMIILQGPPWQTVFLKTQKPYSKLSNCRGGWNKRGGYYLRLFGHYIKNHVLLVIFLKKNTK